MRTCAIKDARFESVSHYLGHNRDIRIAPFSQKPSYSALKYSKNNNFAAL